MAAITLGTPYDPNNPGADPSVVVRTQPGSGKAWIKSTTGADGQGVWSGTLVIQNSSPGAGYIEVPWGTVTLANGDKYRVVTNPDGSVMSEVGDKLAEPDPAQRKVWEDAQDNAKPPGGITEKNVNGSMMRWNPQTRAYDIPTGQAPVATGATTKPPIPPGGSSSTEGTPDPSKPNGWDNQRPRQVIKDKNGNVVWSEELTGSDLTAWRAQQQANQPQTGEVRTQVPNRPGWTSVKRKRVEGGNTTETETFIGPDGKEVPTLPAETKTDRKPVEGQPGVYLVTTTNGTKSDTHFVNEAGQTVPAPSNLPATIVSGGTTYVRGPNNTYAPAQGIPTGATPEGAPRPSGALGDAAKDLDALDQWLDPQVRAGKVTPAQADKIRENRRAWWDLRIKEQQAVVNAQSTTFGQNLQQRGQDLSEGQSKRATAAGIANQASNDWMPLATKLGKNPGAGTALMRAIAEQRTNVANFVSQQGGNTMVAPVQPGPALATVNGMPLPGGAAGAPVQPMNPAFNPRPNAIGVGAGGTIFRPQPVAPPPASPDRAAAEAVRQQQAAAGGATGTPAAPVPPVATPAPPVTAGPNPATPNLYPPAPSVNPPAGEPGNDPTKPVGVIQPSPYFLAQSSRGHVYDPTNAVQSMIDDPSIDNEVIRQVVAQDYPGYPIDRLLQGRAA
jgi:hypothetical protein